MPPPAAFTTSCAITFLPDDCTGRIVPSQINAIISEMLCFAQTLDPDGNWDCDSNCNLATLFQQWVVDTTTQTDGITVDGDGTPLAPIKLIPLGAVEAICADPDARNGLSECIISSDASNLLRVGSEGGLFAGLFTTGDFSGDGTQTNPLSIDVTLEILAADNVWTGQNTYTKETSGAGDTLKGAIAVESASPLITLKDTDTGSIAQLSGQSIGGNLTLNADSNSKFAAGAASVNLGAKGVNALLVYEDRVRLNNLPLTSTGGGPKFAGEATPTAIGQLQFGNIAPGTVEQFVMPRKGGYIDKVDEYQFGTIAGNAAINLAGIFDAQTREFDILCEQLVLSAGTTGRLFQFLTGASTVVSAGYGSNAIAVNTSAVGGGTATAGIAIDNAASVATVAMSGAIRFTRRTLTSNIWYWESVMYTAGQNQLNVGRISVGATVTGLRLTTLAGNVNFTSGNVDVRAKSYG